MNKPRSIESLSAAELEVICDALRRERREFVTSFMERACLPANHPGRGGPGRVRRASRRRGRRRFRVTIRSASTGCGTHRDVAAHLG
jgi:hypothetical protein